MLHIISVRLRHFFHVVSKIRPIIWLLIYLGLIPVFAFIYMYMPAGQFRIPEGAGTDYGSWIYYSIVTITTLGFGDYTPAHQLAQLVTAIEVFMGLTVFGLFLNAVGSMKSEIDVSTELEKQRLVKEAQEKEKLEKMAPIILRSITIFLSHCYEFKTSTGAPSFSTVERILNSASHTSLCLDSMQNKIDLTQWPDLMEHSFAFVASWQMFDSSSIFNPQNEDKDAERHRNQTAALEAFVKETSGLAEKIQTDISKI